MKRIFFILVCWLMAIQGISQNLSPTQFTLICDKSPGEVEEYLTANNWTFYEAKGETQNKLGNAKFVYDRPNFKLGDSADYLLFFHYSERVKARGIEVLFKNKAMYKNFNEQMANLKYKLTNSTIDNGSIIKVYKKGPQIIEVTIPPNFKGMNGYRYLFAKNSSYKKIRNK
ncbi:hypothetical protein POV27_06695 [Aureisphaera galaxeae]|uniref:hypothetical protein n=1 Tax=Aureisphaera galaxeae TaxID=1538023 RepID=UPI002350502E|nr:hypothetical protein [Aureisphaera galaxeae]MDC8003732.1 hypothetical protein [Aureisphaera galaxeae]